MDDYNEEVLKKTGGELARIFIDRLYLEYDARRAQIEADPTNKSLHF